MKLNIRKSVFETNSSSMHSLAVIGADRMSQSNFHVTNIDGVEKILVQSDEYGWSGDDLTTPLEKLSYIATMIQYKDSSNEIADSKYFQWLSDMVKDYTGYGLSYVPYLEGDKWNVDGYIDHQSNDTLDNHWSTNEGDFKSNMKDVVFNDKYFIVIDNDNH